MAASVKIILTSVPCCNTLGRKRDPHAGATASVANFIRSKVCRLDQLDVEFSRVTVVSFLIGDWRFKKKCKGAVKVRFEQDLYMTTLSYSVIQV